MYGGTKTEMERLLADAQKLTGVKYDIDNLADVYDAIHVVQTELGITGTTALESAETLAGSFASMKSSFTNFLGNLALGEDVTPSLTALAETVSTFLFGNFLPMVGNIFKALPESIVTFIQVAAPKVIEAGGQLIEQLATGITTGLPGLLSKAETIATNIMGTITEKFPEFLEKGVEIIKNIANGILKAIPKLIESAGIIISNFLSFIMTNLPKILTAGKDLLLSLVKGIIDNLPSIVNSAIQAIGKFIDTLVANLPKIIQTGIKIVVELVNGIINRLPDLIAAAVTLVAKFVAMIISKLPDIIAAGKDILASIVSGIGQVAINLYNKGTELMSGLVAKIKEKIIDFINAGKDIVEGLWNGILEMKDWLIDKVKGFASDIAQSFKDFFGIESPSTLMASFGQYISQGLAQGITENEHIPLNAITSVGKKMASAAIDAVETVMDLLTIDASGITINGPSGRVAVSSGNSSSNKRKKEDMKKYGDEIGAISDRQKVDLSTAYEMWTTNEREKIFGRTPKYALGTNFHPGGWAIVGEKGPELVDLPTGSKVYDSKKTEEMGKNVVQNITINSPNPLTPSEVARQTKNASRNLAMEW